MVYALFKFIISIYKKSCICQIFTYFLNTSDIIETSLVAKFFVLLLYKF